MNVPRSGDGSNRKCSFSVTEWDITYNLDNAVSKTIMDTRGFTCGSPCLFSPEFLSGVARIWVLSTDKYFEVVTSGEDHLRCMRVVFCRFGLPNRSFAIPEWRISEMVSLRDRWWGLMLT